MEGSIRNIQPLTAEEITQLEGQGDKIMQLLAAFDQALFDNSIELGVAMAAYGEARMECDRIKAEKATLVERARNMKALLQQFPSGGASWRK